MVAVKICGVRTPEDAQHAVDAGADAIGLNFYPGSKRHVSLEAAKAIVDAIAERALTVGVFVDMPIAEVMRVREQTGIVCVQLHGDESPADLERLLPHAYKAVRVKGPQALLEASRFGGEHVMLDAYVKGSPGGTGATFDWAVAAELAHTRKVTLAGGLTPDNVGQAVQSVRPFCVDVASGVESSPGVKDRTLVDAFIRNARSA